MNESLGVRFHREATTILKNRNKECVQIVHQMARILLFSHETNWQNPGKLSFPAPFTIELENFSKLTAPLIEFTIDEYMEEHFEFFYKNIRTKSLDFTTINRDYRSHLSRIRTRYYKSMLDPLVEQER